MYILSTLKYYNVCRNEQNLSIFSILNTINSTFTYFQGK